MEESVRQVTPHDIVGHMKARVVDEPELEEMFARLNAHHFGRQLPTMVMIEAPHNGHFAYYVPLSPIGMIGFDPRTLQQDSARIADSMLHEMIHAFLHRSTGDADQAHGRAFAKEANRIGPILFALSLIHI